MQKVKKMQQDETKYHEETAQKEQEQQVNELASMNYIQFGIMLTICISKDTSFFYVYMYEFYYSGNL